MIAPATPPTIGQPCPVEHRLVLRGIGQRLDREFGSVLDRETITRALRASSDALLECSPGPHGPTYVERFARQRLLAVTRNEGLAIDRRPLALFVDRGNDGRSQIAAALFRHRVGDRAMTASGGIAPVADLLPDVVNALQEVGVELLGEFPKPLAPEIVQAADVIVAVDSEAVAAFEHDRRVEIWPVGDPVDGGLNAYRGVRHELMLLVDGLVERIAPPTPAFGRAGFDDDLEELAVLVDRMGRNVRAMVVATARALAAPDAAAFAGVSVADAGVDAAHHSITSRVMELIALRQPVAGDLRALLALDGTSLHLERIGDSMVDIATVMGHVDDAPADRLPPALGDMLALVEVMTGDAVAAVIARSSEGVDGVAATERRLDAAHAAVFRSLTDGETGRPTRLAIGVDRMSRAIKRAGEHALDIAELALFAESSERRELRHSPP